MTSRSDVPLARLAAAFAVVVAMAACSDTSTAPEPAPEPAPAPAPNPAPAPDPAPDPAPEVPEPPLPAEVAETRDALLAAARAEDWDALGALIPDEFSSNFSGEDDHLAYYRSLDTDVFARIVELLEGPSATDGDITAWPELHGRSPFTIGEDERADLEARFGADKLEEWERAGDYLGWRLGIAADGEWRFLIAGD